MVPVGGMGGMSGPSGIGSPGMGGGSMGSGIGGMPGIPGLPAMSSSGQGGGACRYIPAKATEMLAFLGAVEVACSERDSFYQRQSQRPAHIVGENASDAVRV